MHSKIFGILLFRKVIKENNLYVKILSEKDEIITGIVYGGNSSKKKNIYQTGYFLNIRLSKKYNNSPYSIEAEIGKPLLSSLINDKYKLYCLLSIISIINLSIIEGQNLKGIFNCSTLLIKKLVDKKRWILFYCIWLFDILKVIGYEIDYIANQKKNYFDVKTLNFTENHQKTTLIFPHEFLKGNEKINYSKIKSIFIIFEHIYNNNHLIHSKNQLPVNYLNFKNLIFNYLKKIND